MLNLTANAQTKEYPDLPLRAGFPRNVCRITRVTDGGSGYMPIISPVKIKPPAPKGDSGNRRSASGQVA